MEYDEEEILFVYLRNHCPQLLTEQERRAANAALLRAKMAAAHRQEIQSMLKAKCLFGDAEVDAALADGVDAFYRRVSRRVLSDPAAAAQINRCPRCRRVVRTPAARQCFWCGRDWHDVGR